MGDGYFVEWRVFSGSCIFTLWSVALCSLGPSDRGDLHTGTVRCLIQARPLLTFSVYTWLRIHMLEGVSDLLDGSENAKPID